MSKKATKQYALYKNDDFIDIGTSEELAKKINTTRAYILWLAGSNRWKNKEIKKMRKHYNVVCVD